MWARRIGTYMLWMPTPAGLCGATERADLSSHPLSSANQRSMWAQLIVRYMPLTPPAAMYSGNSKLAAR